MWRKEEKSSMSSVDFNSKKIGVVGIGGIGGYVGALLADKYSDVTFVVRGARKELIEKNGLTLTADYTRSRTVKPAHVASSADELKDMDYIFICVKNYSLEQVCGLLKNAVKEGTVIVPVMNGVNPGDRVREYLEREGVKGATVMDSLIYIVSFIGEDGSIIQQGDYANMYIGIKGVDGTKSEEVVNTAKLLDDAGMDCEAAADIEREIWKKYMLNAAFNVETARYNNTIGQLREDPYKANQYETLVREAYMVAKAKNVDVNENDVAEIIDKFYHRHNYDATSSLQRDVVAHRTTELDTFCGYLVKEGERLGLKLPVTNEMYAALVELTR